MDNGDATKDEETSFSIKDRLYSVKIDGKMALISMYDDLPHFEYDTTIDNLKKSNKKLNIFVKELEQLIRKLEKENSQLKKINSIASKNIVSLYKTASKEIKRKDIMINELRNSSSECKLEPVSKMFTSRSLQLEETQVNKLSYGKQDALQVSSTEKKLTMQNQNNIENISNISIEPNNDIPKTIYYKRMCQKLTNHNENTITEINTTKYKNNNCTITSKSSSDKNVCLDNDNYILRKLESPTPYNELKKNSSTQIICEPDIIISDNEFNTSSVTQCENSKKDKENNSSIPSFSSKPRPKRTKKKFVITPAYKCIKNMSNDTSQCIKKLSKNKNLEIKLVNKNPPENKLVKTQEINNSESILFKDNFSTKINSETNDEQFLKTDMNIIHKPLVFTADNNNQTPSLNIEMEQVSYRKKIEKNDPTKEISQATSAISSVHNNLSLKENFLKCLSMKNEKKSLNLPTEKNNHIVCPLNDANESSPKNLAIKMDFGDKISIHSKNIKVDDQMPITKKTVTTGTVVKKCVVKRPLRGQNNYFGSSDNNINFSSNSVKGLSSNNEKESSNQPTIKNNQLVCPLNNTNESSPKNLAIKMDLADKISIHSKNTEVDQMPITKKMVVTGTNVNKCVIKRSLQGKTNYFESSNDNINLSTNSIKDLSTNNKKKSSNQPTENNNQLLSPLNDANESSSKNLAVKIDFADNISIHSKNIEVNQMPITKNTVVTGTVVKKCTIQKPLQGKRNSFESSDINNLKLSQNDVKCLSTNNEKESSSQSTEKNNQLECPLNDIVKNSPNKFAVEKGPADKISVHLKNNNRVDQVLTIKNTAVLDIVKKATIRRSSQNKRKSFVSSDINDLILSPNFVKCLSMNNEKESSSQPMEKSDQHECKLNDIVKSSPKNSAVKMDFEDKISIHSKNTDFGQVSISKNTVVTGINDTVQVTKIGSRIKRNHFDFSIANDVKLPTINLKYSSINNEQLSSQSKEINNQLELKLNEISQSSPEKAAFDTSHTNKTNKTSENFETDKDESVKMATTRQPWQEKRKECSEDNDKKKFSNQTKQNNYQLGCKLNDTIENSLKTLAVETNHMSDILKPFVLNEVEQSPFNRRKRKVILRNKFYMEIKARESLCPVVDNELNEYTKNVPYVSSPKSIISDNVVVCSNVSSDENNQEVKKGRRVKLITIQDHYSEPLPSFNGAKKTEIDVSKTSVHIEKVVESSSRFYVPQAKRRRCTNFTSSDS